MGVALQAAGAREASFADDRILSTRVRLVPLQGLVVESDTGTLDHLRKIFASVPVSVRFESNVADTLTALKDFAADLVLIEADPQGMDGPGLLRQMRSRQTSPQPERDCRSNGGYGGRGAVAPDVRDRNRELRAQAGHD